jgi:hypothetical protein
MSLPLKLFIPKIKESKGIYLSIVVMELLYSIMLFVTIVEYYIKFISYFLSKIFDGEVVQMGLFSRKKKQKEMDVPPPPPEEGETIEAPMEEPGQELPELPPLEAEKEETHIESDLPEIKPPAEKGKMPEFPEIPEEEPEELPVLEEEHPAEEEAPAEEGPKFMNVSSFGEIMAEADSIKQSLKEVDMSVKALDELKKQEEAEFQRWRSQLEDVEKKLSYVDKVIFKGE